MTQRTPTSRRVALAAFLVVAAGACALAGCSAPPPAEDVNEFTVFGLVAEVGESQNQAVIDAFEAEYPEYSVTLEESSAETYGETLRTQLQAGTAADVLFVSPGRADTFSGIEFAEAGLLLPLDDTNAATTIPPGAENLFEVDGKVYMQGLDLAVFASVVANETLLAADGLEYPSTYDELLDACAVAVENGRSFFVLAGSIPQNTGLSAMTMAGDLVYADDPTWNDEREADEVSFADTDGWGEVLDRFSEMSEAGCFQAGAEGGTFDTLTNNMLAESAYAFFAPSGFASTLSGAAPGSTFVVHPFPAGNEEDTLTSATVVSAFAINAKSDAIPAAKEFLDFLSTPEAAAIYSEVGGGLPIVGTDFANLPAEYAGVAPLLEEGRTYPLPNQGWASSEVYLALGTGIQGILTSQATRDQVLADMDAAW